VIAAAVAGLAAVAEARGVPIVPQIRRQLPEQWRRVMPMPIAAFLYGILLGLGFTTFVLSFGVWALAGISFAVGDPVIGALIGVGFGVGRAIPIVGLAPLAGTERGNRVTALMAERAGIYRGFRLGDAVVLTATAAVLAFAAGGEIAEAADTVREGASDPDVQGADVVYELTSGTGVLLRNGNETILPGGDPAIGGQYIAVRSGDLVRILNRTTLVQIASVTADGVNALAIDTNWLVYRRARDSEPGDAIKARPLAGNGTPGAERSIDHSDAPAMLSGPSVDGDRAVYSLNGRRNNYLRDYNLATSNRRTIESTNDVGYWNPDLNGDRLTFVRAGRNSYKLRIRHRSLSGTGRTLLKRSRSSEGLLWSTALGNTLAYVTVLKDTATSPNGRVDSVPR
jgi:hypothetical protein